MDLQLIVKILNGPHAGAQLEIPPEGLLLGSDDECDLIIFDEKIAPQHLRLTPQEGGFVVLTPLEGKVFLDGVAIKGDTILENPAQVITAGSTHLVAGSADQEWPEIVLPEELGDSEEQQNLDQVAEERSPDLKKNIRQKKRFKLSKILIGGGTLIVVGAGAYLAYEAFSNKEKFASTPKSLFTQKASSLNLKKLNGFWDRLRPLQQPTAINMNQASSKASVAETQNKVSWQPVPIEVKVTQNLLTRVPGVVFSINEKDKRKQFDVWVRGEEAATQARRILDQASPPLAYNLIDLSQLENSAKILAQLYGLTLQVRVDAEGIAFWKGYLRDDKNWQTFIPRVTQDLPAIRDNRCEIVFGSRLAPILLAALRKQSFFADNISPVAGETGLLFQGFLRKEQKPDWDAWIATIREKYAATVPIVDEVNSATIVKRSLKEFFPSEVLGIAGSVMPWISLADGSKFFPGAKLKNGYTLDSITSDTLWINGPNGKINFTLSTLN